ncbi:hypothetical protein DCO58_12440 [Helicobacter saguini]|uniref:Uncharacterized protein n=1 Tax=Helicobacter saguini TaxID=1548018 RepID=A0A347VQL5_9HELI|nr:hypothetical protein [Helicobacter saguini]MWV60902.1 hypothetical protein [Helicobacter saguini]MWV68430.1 hypothetical protein [Helicobacter saguini]MWV70106.1 hypothetical protein [Helicobacter saguini]MWV72009.1 hypothetical protein [Helicobacter saguini]TLD93767.1 hypothetical protein LS64_008215 [Helicobacter saguini]
MRDIKSEFETDINEGSKYLESLQYDFVNKIVNLYMNKYLTPFGITFKPQVSEDSKLQLMKEFIESLNDIFKIYAFKPNVEIADMDETLEGTYTLYDNTIRVSRLASNLYYPYEIFMILVHEYRLNPHEKDAFLMEQILNLVIESTFAIKFNKIYNSKLR